MTSVNELAATDKSKETKPAPSQPKSNLWVRLLTGMILLPVAIVAVGLGSVVLLGVAFLLILLGTLEFFFMEKNRGATNNAWLGLGMAALVLAAFYMEQAWLWQITLLSGALLTFALEFLACRMPLQCLRRVATTIGGVLYIAFPAGMALLIRNTQPDGLFWMFAILFTTMSVDTFSYFAGKLFGKRPLAPQLSPNKTIEGAVGGIIASTLITSIFLAQVNLLTVSVFFFLIIATLVAIAGDLFESAMKRYFGVKDSGVPHFNPFPGHGGVLDRVDALLWVIIAYYIFLSLQGQVTPLF